MTGEERASILSLTHEVRAYHADLQTFKRDVEPVIDFYKNVLGISRFLKWGVGIGAGGATIAIALHAFGLV